MTSPFSGHHGYGYKAGSLFLGRSYGTAECGIETERHLITIAGAGAGKGQCLIIPNLRRWRGAALVVDPKGENCEETYAAREAMGQMVGALDPFHAADIPERLRVSFNPLALIDPESITAREDILVVADGIVKRTNRDDAVWDDGAMNIIAGVIAFNVLTADPEDRSLTNVRKILTLENEVLYKTAQVMLEFDGCGGLARAAAVAIMSALDAEKGMDKEFLAGARRQSSWLDSPAIAKCLSASSFDISKICNDKGTLYVILPYRYMNTHAAFMRLIVRTTQNSLAAAGNKRGNRCLFILDEFFTLGRIDEIATGAGNMRSYGLQLWPFLQDLGQLQAMYGKETSETFFANADAHIFFGNTDTLTLAYISQRMGRIEPKDISSSPPFAEKFDPYWSRRWFEKENDARERIGIEEKNNRAYYDHIMKDVGKPRMTPADVAKAVGKGNGDAVARGMIVFAKTGDILKVQPAPAFKEPPPAPASSGRRETPPSGPGIYSTSAGRAEKGGYRDANGNARRPTSEEFERDCPAFRWYNVAFSYAFYVLPILPLQSVPRAKLRRIYEAYTTIFELLLSGALAYLTLWLVDSYAVDLHNRHWAVITMIAAAYLLLLYWYGETLKTLLHWANKRGEWELFD